MSERRYRYYRIRNDVTGKTAAFRAVDVTSAFRKAGFRWGVPLDFLVCAGEKAEPYSDVENIR